MRFLVDESSGPNLARWLREQGHEVFSVYEQSRGISDQVHQFLCNRLPDFKRFLKAMAQYLALSEIAE